MIRKENFMTEKKKGNIIWICPYKLSLDMKYKWDLFFVSHADAFSSEYFISIISVYHYILFSFKNIYTQLPVNKIKKIIKDDSELYLTYRWILVVLWFWILSKVRKLGKRGDSKILLTLVMKTVYNTSSILTHYGGFL